tara:strand:+ start:821 stop:1099 length:279 start_codon:yes stop_codon:yes gene_type:complete
MKLTLKSGKTVKLKDLSVDERDELLDSVTYEGVGDELKMTMMHSTMTKFIRIGLDEKVTDDFLKKLSFSDRTEIFTAIQKELLVLGEDEASE